MRNIAGLPFLEWSVKIWCKICGVIHHQSYWGFGSLFPQEVFWSLIKCFPLLQLCLDFLASLQSLPAFAFPGVPRTVVLSHQVLCGYNSVALGLTCTSCEWQAVELLEARWATAAAEWRQAYVSIHKCAEALLWAQVAVQVNTTRSSESRQLAGPDWLTLAFEEAWLLQGLLRRIN